MVPESGILGENGDIDAGMINSREGVVAGVNSGTLGNHQKSKMSRYLYSCKPQPGPALCNKTD